MLFKKELDDVAWALRVTLVVAAACTAALFIGAWMEWQAGNTGEAAGAAVIGLFIGIVTYVLIVLARSD